MKLIIAAGLAQALGGAVGILSAVLAVACFGGLGGALIAALSERHVGGVKTALVIAAVAGLAWILVQAFFTAGGIASNVTIQAIN